MRTLRLLSALALSAPLLSCGTFRTGNQIVLLGEDPIPGSRAVGEANLAIRNANAAGCNAISVGGYGLASEVGVDGSGAGSLIGVPVLVECPPGVSLLPNGAAAP